MTAVVQSEANLALPAAAHIDDAGNVHLLADHLRAVAGLARIAGETFGGAEISALAGQWHDLGKYSGDFQSMIHGAHGIDAHIEGEGGPRDHSTAGAVHATRTIDDEDIALVVACTIAGHHAGLADRAELRGRLHAKNFLLDHVIARKPPQALLDLSGGLALPSWVEDVSDSSFARTLDVYIRLVFSALVDADFLDTETFFSSDRAQLRGNHATLPALRDALDAFMREKTAHGEGLVHAVRQDVLRACIEASEQRPGCFSLTVPTGGGKTLAAMAFALHHAVKHGLDRVIVAIPFTSIIEQTAEVYRQVFGAENVVEHHSSLAPGDDERHARNRVACENWDAPIVVTTNVQLFESMFANRPSSCRKVHRIVRSVLILDEAQTVPAKLLPPILDMLNTLTRSLRTSLVISTATQPVWSNTGLPRALWVWGLENVREICNDSLRLNHRLERVRVRRLSEAPLSTDEVARELSAHPTALAIVHRRDLARELCESVDSKRGDSLTAHLSALMTPDHRTFVLAAVKNSLREERPTLCVATQLVEAGVDIDFPIVLRALAGIDSLTQAAGRCNREGRLPSGELLVFEAEKPPPVGILRTALGITKLLWKNEHTDLFSPQLHREYFRTLYANTSVTVGTDLQEAREALNFREVARYFKLIDDGGMAPLVVALRVRGVALRVSWLPQNEVACETIDQLERFGPSRQLLRRLQRFTVNVPARALAIAHGVRRVADSLAVLENADAYHSRFGVLLERLGEFDPERLIV